MAVGKSLIRFTSSSVKRPSRPHRLMRRKLTRIRLVLLVLLVSVAQCAVGQQSPTLGTGVKGLIRVSAPVIALMHVRVIDGTGAPAREDQSLIIADGKILSLGPASDITP